MSEYQVSVLALLALALMIIAQLVVVDLARGRAGIKPGMAVDGGPSSFVFRAQRAHANTLENLGVFVLVAVLAMMVKAPSEWVDGACVGFLAARLGHMASYYLGWIVPRTVSWIAGLVATGVLISVTALEVL